MPESARPALEDPILGRLTAALELSGGNAVNVDEIECVHRGDRGRAWKATWQ